MLSGIELMDIYKGLLFLLQLLFSSFHRFLLHNSWFRNVSRLLRQLLFDGRLTCYTLVQNLRRRFFESWWLLERFLSLRRIPFHGHLVAVGGASVRLVVLVLIIFEILLVVVISVKVLWLIASIVVLLLLIFVLLPLPSTVLDQHVIKLSQIDNILKRILLDKLLQIYKVFVNCILAQFYELRKVVVQIQVILASCKRVTIGELNVRHIGLKLL